MGLFGKLFTKEECCNCGQEVGTLKKRKLADGVMCNDCTKLLSPFFDDRKESTIEQIKSQIADREQNKIRLQGFQASKAFGDFGCILIDESNRQFCCVSDTSDGLFKSAKKVTDIAQVIDRNPDVISFSQIVDVDMDIVFNTQEEKRMEGDKQVSYNPERWTYMFTFYLIIKVNHPYIKQIRIQLNNGAVRIQNEGKRLRNSPGELFAQWLLDCPQYNIQQRAAFYDDHSLMDFMARNKYAMPEYSYGFKCSLKNWEEIKRYEFYLHLGATIRGALMGV